MEVAITQEKRGEIERLQRQFANLLSENEILRATAQGINRALARSISKLNRGIKSEYNVTQKYLSRMAVVSPKAYGTRLYGGIKLNFFPVPVIGFKPKQTRGSITVAIHKGKTVVIRNSFITTMISGHEGVYSRGRYGKAGFVPERAKTAYGKVRITEIRTKSPFGMGTDRRVADEVQHFMADEVMARVEGILKYKVKKLSDSNK